MIPERSPKYVRYKLQKSLRKWGLLGTLNVCIVKVGVLIRRLNPRYRRAKALDWKFDRTYGVETECIIPPDDLDASSRAQFRKGYQATPVFTLQLILNNLHIAYDDFVFIDVGSGMGRAVLLASEFPFKKIVGVECIPELDRIAKRNVLNFRNGKQKCRNIELVCMDAVEYDVPAQNAVFYLFNPFEKPILEKVLANIGRSLRDHPRSIVIAYYNAQYDLVEMAPFLKRVWNGETDYTFAVYRNNEDHRVTRRAASRPFTSTTWAALSF